MDMSRIRVYVEWREHTAGLGWSSAPKRGCRIEAPGINPGKIPVKLSRPDGAEDYVGQFETCRPSKPIPWCVVVTSYLAPLQGASRGGGGFPGLRFAPPRAEVCQPLRGEKRREDWAFLRAIRCGASSLVN